MTGSVAERIAALDAERDCEEIVRLLTTREFAWDIERSLEFALFRTYAVPSISGLLSRTGEFAARTRKRYDDTELILSEIVENGFDSPRGQAALDRMNAMHGRFRIDPRDMAYVLSTFVVEPVRWLARFGRRAMTAHEEEAWFCYYRELGRRMGIAGVPESLAAMRAFNADYEAAHFRPAATNAEIAGATRDLLIGFYLPRALVPMGRPAVRAFMDPPLLAAMGMAPAPGWLTVALMTAMAMRRRVLRLLPPRRRAKLLTRARRPGYPAGYRIEELGTFGGAGRD